MANNEHKTIIRPRQITSPRISAGVNRCPENATPTVFFGHIRVHRPRLVFRDIKYIPDDRSSWRSRWKREPLSSSVVAEDNKEAKEGDGKRANGIDEKERIMTGKVACGGIMRAINHAFTLCAVHCHRGKVSKTLSICSPISATTIRFRT